MRSLCREEILIFSSYIVKFMGNDSTADRLITEKHHIYLIVILFFMVAFRHKDTNTHGKLHFYQKSVTGKVESQYPLKITWLLL